jgi:tryptophan synthase alpha chain
MDGLEHISQAFVCAKSQRRAALMPYYTLGFPDAETSLKVIQSIAEAGADLIELGIPFSDPLADGPTIQHSAQVALEKGMTVDRCLEMVARLRKSNVSLPLLLMGYYNPVLAYGVSRFVFEAASAGADGFIIPDLPVEEAGEMEAACQKFGRALVFLVAPTSTPERIAANAAHTTGFLYLVSLTGVTGARSALPEDLAGFAQRARSLAAVPIAVGFGISTPAQVASVGQFADGVIVGSALINAVENSKDPDQSAADFVSSLRYSV